MNVITAENLKAPRPSTDWLQQLKTSMRAFAGQGDPLGSVFYDETWPGRQAWHCVYSVGLETIKDLTKLDGINKPLCWRFIAGGHESMTTAAGCWTTHEYSGTAAKVMATLQSPEMAEMLANAERLNHLNDLSGYPRNQYELRVLRIPGLCIEAFWLKSLSARRADLIVPYGLVSHGSDRIKLCAGENLHKNKAYPAAEFLEMIRDAASKRLAADNKVQRVRAAGA
jgi:hypothetical protein